MEENLNEVRRPVYRNLRIIWLLILIGLVLSFWGDKFSAVGVVLAIVRLVQVGALADVSDALARAYRVMCIGLALTIGCLLLGLLALGSILSVIFSLAALAGAVVLLVSEYYFYSGLDGLIALRGYAYPQGRIKWCFWISLIGMVIAGIANGRGRYGFQKHVTSW